MGGGGAEGFPLFAGRRCALSFAGGLGVVTYLLPFSVAVLQVHELLAGRVVVGHSINKDFKVLLLSHPHKDIRDTAR